MENTIEHMLVFYIARQLESTEMQILSPLKMRGKKSISLKRRGEVGWSEGKVINKSDPRWRGACKTQIQISCKGTGSHAHMSSVCFCLEPWGFWGLSSWVSPHTTGHAIEPCSGMFLLPSVFSFPSFCPLFFPSWKQLVV